MAWATEQADKVAMERGLPKPSDNVGAPPPAAAKKAGAHVTNAWVLITQRYILSFSRIKETALALLTYKSRVDQVINSICLHVCTNSGVEAVTAMDL